jgi:hypothetical protein
VTTTENPPEKQLLRCEHPSIELCECRTRQVEEMLARWDHVVQPPRVEDLVRERVVLAERAKTVRVEPHQLAITNDDERYGDSLLGAFGAWSCLAISVLLMLTLAIHSLWMWM